MKTSEIAIVVFVGTILLMFFGDKLIKKEPQAPAQSPIIIDKEKQDKNPNININVNPPSPPPKPQPPRQLCPRDAYQLGYRDGHYHAARNPQYINCPEYNLGYDDGVRGVRPRGNINLDLRVR